MKKYLAVMLLCYSVQLFSCDFCGCSPTVMNTDVMSIQPQSSAGTSLQYRSYAYKTSSVNLKNTHVATQTFFVSYAPKKWVDIRLSMPLIWMVNKYKMVNENTPKIKETKFGAGDLLLFSNFRVVAKPPIGNKKVGHVVNLGYGMSFPTGSKKTSENVLLQDFNFGTQMIAFYFSGAYSLSVKKWGLVNAALVKINMYNKDKVKYGNMYSYQISANYTHSFKHVLLTPIIGIRSDISSKNLHNNIIQNKSGGWALAFDASLQCTIKDFAFNVGISQPVVQKISAGEMVQKTGVTAMLRYQIKRKPKIVNEAQSSIK